MLKKTIVSRIGKDAEIKAKTTESEKPEEAKVSGEDNAAENSPTEVKMAKDSASLVGKGTGIPETKRIINEVKNGKELFPVHTKFTMNYISWRVVNAFCDSNTNFRELHGSDGSHQVVTLDTLLKDSKSAGFSFEELTAAEKLLSKLPPKRN